MDAILRQLCDLDGVGGALVLSRDGHPLASVMEDDRAQTHATQAAAIFALLDRYTRAVAVGSPRQLVVETPTATLVITVANDMLLLLEASADAPLGRMKLAAAQAARLLVR